MSMARKPFDSYDFGEQLADLARTYLIVFDATTEERHVSKLEEPHSLSISISLSLSLSLCGRAAGFWGWGDARSGGDEVQGLLGLLRKVC